MFSCSHPSCAVLNFCPLDHDPDASRPQQPFPCFPVLLPRQPLLSPFLPPSLFLPSSPSARSSFSRSSFSSSLPISLSLSYLCTASMVLLAFVQLPTGSSETVNRDDTIVPGALVDATVPGGHLRRTHGLELVMFCPRILSPRMFSCREVPASSPTGMHHIGTVGFRVSAPDLAHRVLVPIKLLLRDVCELLEVNLRAALSACNFHAQLSVSILLLTDLVISRL